MSKCLVTGASGFLGKHLILWLEQAGHEVIAYHHADGEQTLKNCCRKCDIVFHLAGVNRPKLPEEFEAGNVGFTEMLVNALAEARNDCTVIFASSIQAESDNPYGRSKQRAENILLTYGNATGADIRIYRLPNVFGKWCRPNYNSVVATFCHNQAHGLPLVIHDASRSMELVHVDDVMMDFLDTLQVQKQERTVYRNIPVSYRKTVGEVATIIKSFGNCCQSLHVPEQEDGFLRKLYSTYLSYLPLERLSYPLCMHTDDRGSFTEFMRTKGQGQFSVNISHPHITKGNHWHHTKHEKFLVVSGEGVIRLRKLETEDVIAYQVSGRKLEVIEIPPGCTHNIENTGKTDMVTLMWANENYDSKCPDTYRLEV